MWRANRLFAVYAVIRKAILPQLRNSYVYRMWLSDARYRLVWEVFDDEHRVAIYYVGLKPDYDELLA